MHLTRYAMYRDLRRFFRRHPQKGRVLAISGVGEIGGFLEPEARITGTLHPGVDIQRLPFRRGSFDLAYSDQVLMYVPDLARAVAESFRVVKPGGLVLHTASVMSPIWADWKDYWRITCEGLRRLCSGYGRVLLCGSWGNRKALDLSADKGLRYEQVVPGSPLEKLALANEPDYPIHTWIVVRKSSK